MKYVTSIVEASEKIERYIDAFDWQAKIHGGDGIYSASDKKELLEHWDHLSPLFQALRSAIQQSRRSWWRSKDKKTKLAILILTTRLYYRGVLRFQGSLGKHEDFVRLYLDEKRRSNYSTVARYMYRWRFLLSLRFPYEWLLTLADETDPAIYDLYLQESRSVISITHSIGHDQSNIWYYLRFRLENIVSLLAKHIGRIMAHISLKPWRMHTLITQAQQKQIESSLESGDILLTRKNWAATNLNIPGYWKHMALYLGDGVELRHTLERLKIKTRAKIYPHQKYIIESIGGGVRILSTKEFFDHYDSIAVVRVSCPDERKNYAVQEAIKMYGHEYDYRFNYLSDRRMVCSALATKGYLPRSITDDGLHITLEMIGLNLTYPPNSLVKKMYQEQGSPRHELSYIIGYHTHEKTQTTHSITPKDFYQSWSWSKLSFFLP